MSETEPETPGDAALFEAYLALSHAISVPVGSPLAPLPGEAPEETPRYYVARAAWGAWAVHIRADVDMALRADLAAMAPERALVDPDAVLALFRHHGATVYSTWHGRTSRFLSIPALSLAASVTSVPAGLDVYGERPPTAAVSAAWAGDARDAREATTFTPRQFAIIADGLVVATCESSRESSQAAEAWVRTLPDYRRRGYATRVTAAWARDAFARSKQPFYSHHRDNIASARVARALSLVPFLEDAGYL